MVRHNKRLAGKILLLVVLFVAVLTFLGCVSLGGAPLGWSGVAIADGALYFGSMKGELVALDLNGNPLWQASLEDSGSAGGFGCAPASTSAAIYGTPATMGDLIYTGGYDGKIYAINLSSGALRWVYPRQGNLQPIVGGLVVAQDKLYFGSSDGKVYAIDATTGDREWVFPTGDKIWSTPVISGDTVYIGSFDRKLYAINAADGSKKWDFSTEGPIVSTPVVYNNTVYVASFDRHLYAIDASNGQLIWRFPSADETENRPVKWFWASPALYDNTIYAPSMDGRVYVLDAESGVLITVLDLGNPISSSPVVVEGRVIIASEEGKIYSIDTGNNQSIELRALGSVSAPLAASDGIVYVHVQQDEAIYAIDAETGAVSWNTPIN